MRIIFAREDVHTRMFQTENVQMRFAEVVIVPMTISAARRAARDLEAKLYPIAKIFSWTSTCVRNLSNDHILPFLSAIAV
jgi:hypothetical protein